MGEVGSGSGSGTTGRRGFLRAAGAAALGLGGLGGATAGSGAAGAPARLRVAGIATIYEPGSHADVLLGKILDGWRQDGGPGPALTLASMYIDQHRERDVSRAKSRERGVPIAETIEGALTLGGGDLAVDGVILIGEHGDYPFNAKGQQLYPRRRFFDATADVFEARGRVVPVFNDKHLGPVWEDALATYRRARALGIPFMAGSSMPVGFRVPDAAPRWGSRMEGAAAVGYSGLDIYGIHALEFLQCFVERRAGGERGVSAVRGVSGEALVRALDEGGAFREPLEAALAATPRPAGAAADVRGAEGAALFQMRYVDGLEAAVLMLGSRGAGTAAAVRIAGEPRSAGVRFDERTEPVYPHFAYLLKAIERMFHTGRPSYPVERTLLTTGILDRALTSLAEGGRWIDTPELRISYDPADYPHAPRPDLESDPTRP